MGFLLILILPLAVFLFLGLAGHKLRPGAAGIVGTVSMGVCALLSYAAAFAFSRGTLAPDYLNFTWLRFSDTLHIDLGMMLDGISVMMLCVITTVSLMVHIYSLGYMKGERGFQRYYAFLSLFSFSMLGLVVATNIFQMYIFWELVGVSSYLLIGFYYTRPAAVAASKKAFIVTRFADLGFLIGILILSYYTGTFDFAAITASNGSLVAASTAGASFMGLSVASWAMALIFMGGAGKSAMFPLHIWLPDAMEGPTPVSALIHAATMVVAGVYLVARLFPVYVFVTPDVLHMIGYVGAFTALFAAVIAITQTDIKRVLAFSTISQIAYMMVALAMTGLTAGMFHLFTHAFFKALLFLGAGAVIHAVHTNEMGGMGGLRKYMRVTHITFLIACLAISGIWPFSGFFSKDAILHAAWEHDKVLFFTLWMVSGLTAFYMFRLYFNIFWGRKTQRDHKPHEAGWTMLIPLMVLAALTCVTGFWPFPAHVAWGIAAMGTTAAVIGIALAMWLYKNGGERPARIAQRMGGLYIAALHKFYIDEVWMFVTRKVVFNCVSRPIAWFDRHVVDGAMNGIGWSTSQLAAAIKGFQSGKVQFYAWMFVFGTLVITVLALFL